MSSESASTPPAASLAVMVVDDDRLVRSAMVRTLKRVPGVAVEDFPDGESALERAAVHTFDVAILDLKMPTLDGVRLATMLRDKRPDLRVIFVTADPHGELAQRARLLSPAGVLAKPWSAEDLVRLLRA